MSKTVVILILLAVSSTELESNDPDSTCVARSSGNEKYCSNDSTCSTWFACNAEKTCQCDSKQTYEIVCDDEAQTSAVLTCNCVTYDSDSKSTYVGACFYNCGASGPLSHLLIHELPKNPETLVNTSVCTPFIELAYSAVTVKRDIVHWYFHTISVVWSVPMGIRTGGSLSWLDLCLLQYCIYSYLPFNVNVTSSRLHGVVWYSQFVSVPAFVRIVMLVFSNEDKKYLEVAKVGFVFYSFWNLNIFHSILPNICVDVTTLQALALEYLIALYPFVLVLISYLLIALHHRRVPAVAFVWMPFKTVLTVFRKSWNIHTSVLDSLSTFFLLSYYKIINITFDVLTPTKAYQLSSNKSTFRLYYLPTVPYFGDQHLPYAILAIILVTLFVSIPNWHFLHAFVDIFQGCYKDGTEPGIFDCRWFSVPMLLIWPLHFIIYSLTLSMIFYCI